VAAPDSSVRVALRAARGLVLGLTLSFVNLVGAVATIAALGGPGSWSRTQFIGLFGVLEVSTGAAFLVGPNLWRMPVIEARLGVQPGQVRLAASTVFIPHWAAGVKGIAGLAFVGWAAASEGLAPASLGLPLLTICICSASVGLSLVAARIGVAHPEYDVVQFIVRRPRNRDLALPATSVGATVVQVLLNIGSLPAVKLLSPGVLYGPELAPSPALLAWLAIVAAVLVAGGLAAWWGRLALRAPRRQQREAQAKGDAASMLPPQDADRPKAPAASP
jgi:hypothetical protein